MRESGQVVPLHFSAGRFRLDPYLISSCTTGSVFYNLGDKENKKLKSIFKNFFLNLIQTKLTNKLIVTEKYWGKLYYLIQFNSELKNCFRKKTFKILNILSRLKLTCRNSRGNIKWKTFWNYTTKATEILLKSSKFLKRGWIFNKIKQIEKIMPNQYIIF